jgi:hypothetical protein
MSVAISGRIDQAQNSFQARLGQTRVASVLGTDVDRTLLGQSALLKNIVKLMPVILIEKYVVSHQRKTTGFSMHRQGEC